MLDINNFMYNTNYNYQVYFMALFIHITDEKNLKSIKRNGLKLGAEKKIYAMPCTENYQFNHSWTREIKRHKNFVPIVVLFEVADSTPIKMGIYYRPQEAVDALAKEAFNFVKEADYPLGFQVSFDFPIPAKNIKKIYYLPKVVGWRFSPDSNGKIPLNFQQEGEPFRKKITRLAQKRITRSR